MVIAAQQRLVPRSDVQNGEARLRKHGSEAGGRPIVIPRAEHQRCINVPCAPRELNSRVRATCILKEQEEILSARLNRLFKELLPCGRGTHESRIIEHRCWDHIVRDIKTKLAPKIEAVGCDCILELGCRSGWDEKVASSHNDTRIPQLRA
jgi:hypothetical protein